MKKYSTSEIRELFLNYFKSNNHTIVPSSSLIPANDKTLLFTNAGMVQFKDVFLGQEKYKYTRVATAQRCLRASGKHNDLANVGYTTRHHTFFEMLGNFSFGDYFKREAIHYAWDFLTNTIGLDPKKLWITIHQKDTETEKLWQEEWKKTNTKAQGLSHCGDKDNFWAMGNSGPCGYCSEIFYDHGSQLPGDPPGGAIEGERYIEIWNLVFMQFNRDSDGNLNKLAKPSIDTGMGLERIAAVVQGVSDNYAIDIFANLRDEFYKILNHEFTIDHKILNSSDAVIASRVVVDHIRATVFLILDGIIPSNEHAGFVLRSIIRRAVYYLYRLKITQPSFFLLVQPFAKLFNDAYPELHLEAKAEYVANIVMQEEIKFLDTLNRGIKILDQEIAGLKEKILPGKVVFTLHDTYGFPAILTSEIAFTRGLAIDNEGFESEMEKQRKTSRLASKFNTSIKLNLTTNKITEFIGFVQSSCISKIIEIFKPDGTATDTLQANEEGIIILDKTPFYGESGGQVGDSGKIYSDDLIFIVRDTKKQGSYFLHYGVVERGIISKNTTVNSLIDENRHQAIKLNHSSAHLLHQSLRLILGEHAMQRGSFVDEKRLRFDFTNPTAPTTAQLQEIEQLVNDKIRANLLVQTTIKSLEEAKQDKKIVALFGEKYGDEVRVVTMDDFSKELCGGAHVKQTGEIGLFKIISEASIASGVRRIEAITGKEAIIWVKEADNNLYEMEQFLGVNSNQIMSKLKQIFEEKLLQEKEIKKLQNELTFKQCQTLIADAISVGKSFVLVSRVDLDKSELLNAVDYLKQQLKSATILLATVKNNKIQVVAGVTNDLSKKIKANEILLQHVLKKIDGSGGGRTEIAQGGGTNISALDDTLKSAVQWIKEKI